MKINIDLTLFRKASRNEEDLKTKNPCVLRNRGLSEVSSRFSLLILENLIRKPKTP